MPFLPATGQPEEEFSQMASTGSGRPLANAMTETEFAGFYRQYFKRLVARITALIGCGEVAQDVAQETLIRIWENPGLLDPNRPAWPFIQKVAVNLAYDHVRARARHQRIVKERLERELHPQSRGDDLGRVDDRLDLARALGSISSRHRTMLGLRHVLDLDAAEAARLMGVSRDTAYALMHRAKRSLQSAYERVAVLVWPGLFARPGVLRGRSGVQPSLAGSPNVLFGLVVGGAALGIAVAAGPTEATTVQRRPSSPVTVPATDPVHHADRPGVDTEGVRDSARVRERFAETDHGDLVKGAPPPDEPPPLVDMPEQEIPVTGQRVHTDMYDDPDYDYGIEVRTPSDENKRTGMQTDGEEQLQPADKLACRIATATPVTYCDRASPGSAAE